MGEFILWCTEQQQLSKVFSLNIIKFKAQETYPVYLKLIISGIVSNLGVRKLSN